ncbi:MAG: SlyX family protein [Alphaproteobacteria bacterium]|nr:SlyX family protein [Alphaproteobacteria bacterium]
MQALFILEVAVDDAERIDGLEVRFAHQEQVVADLNEVITAQWKRIELLERNLKRLHEELQNMDQGRNAPEPPPPHY